MSEFIIREGKKDDLPSVFDLVKELAIYEKAEDQVTNTVKMMEEDGFGENPIFGFFVAEVEDRIVGLSLYYYRYSTWKGKRLYLEDIVVTASERGKKMGKALFDKTLNKARETGCTGMMWQVLEWNKDAIAFYEKYGTRFDEEWVNCHLDF